LIFPYPPVRANAEPDDTNLANRPVESSEDTGSGAPGN
jgi:hypothetical protein